MIKRILVFLITYMVLFSTLSYELQAETSREDVYIGGGRSAGISIPSLVTRPYFLQIYPSDNIIVGIEHGYVSFSEFKDDNLTISDASYMYTGIYIRSFIDILWSNNWNIISSLHRREFIFNAKAEVRGTLYIDNYSNSEYKSEIYTFSTGIGYQKILSWSILRGVVLGVDLYIKSYPIYENNSCNVTGNYLSSSDKQAMEKDNDQFINEFNDLSYYGYGIVYLGYSF